MAMLIVTTEQFEKEMISLGLSLPVNASEKQIIEVKDIVHGRGLGRTEVDEEVRKRIASDLLNGESLKQVTEKYDVSTSSASAYKVGATSTASYNKPDKELKDHTEIVKTGIRATALSRLSQALAEITNEKLKKASLKDASGVAKDMSGVVKNLSNEQAAVNVNNRVVVFRPRTREEEDYEVIDVSDVE
jgi:hypothetical protein